jgi:hypothetical protein
MGPVRSPDGAAKPRNPGCSAAGSRRCPALRSAPCGLRGTHRRSRGALPGVMPFPESPLREEGAGRLTGASQKVKLAPLRRPARRFMAPDFHSPAWSALRPGFRPASCAPPLRPSRLAADRSSRSGGRIGTPEARPAGTDRISPRAPPALPVKLRSTRTLNEGRWRDCSRGSGGGDYFVTAVLRMGLARG